MEILGIPWAAAIIYAGYSQYDFWVTVVVGALIGAVMYGVMRSTFIMRVMQEAPHRLLYLLVPQAITVAALYGLGYLFS
jgi:hypothetical protein